MLLNCGVGEDSWESLGLQGDPTSPSWRRSVLGVHWKDWRWSWNSNTLATSCKELTHWKRPWCWEGLGAGGEGDNRGWDSWMASPTQWAWVWVNSGSWWWTGRPGVLRFMGSLRVRHIWVTELNWTDGRPFLCIDIDRHCYRPWSLRINYVTQFSAFQEILWKLWEVTPDLDSESNKLLFEPGTEVLTKTLRSGGQSLSLFQELIWRLLGFLTLTR